MPTGPGGAPPGMELNEFNEVLLLQDADNDDGANADAVAAMEAIIRLLQNFIL